MPLTIEPVGPPGEDEPPRPVWVKLGWFFGLALASAALVAALAYLLRALIV